MNEYIKKLLDRLGIGEIQLKEESGDNGFKAMMLYPDNENLVVGCKLYDTDWDEWQFKPHEFEKAINCYDGIEIINPAT